MCDKCWRDSAGINHDPATCGCDPSVHPTWTPPMTKLGGVPISERAKRLIEALHELASNEAKWMVAQAFLDEEAKTASFIAVADYFVLEEVYRDIIAATPVTPVPASTKPQNHSKDGGEGSVAEE